MKLTLFVHVPVLLVTFGCAVATPTPELVDARRAFEKAKSSDAPTYSPDKLLSAKQALDRAEAAHADDPGSSVERSYAYVAERKAQFASVNGSYEKVLRARGDAAQDYRAKQDTLRLGAEREADVAKKSLATTWDNLSTARRDLAAQQVTSKVELDSEKAARKKAEQTAAAAMASLSKVAQVKEEQRGMVITLDGSVLFVTGKAELLPIARDKLDEVAKALKEMDDDKLASIEGFTDSRGADDANQKLSQERANAVKDYLVAQGANPGKLRAIGRGEGTPVASNETAEGRANNRRVEIVIQTSTQASAGIKP